MLKFEKPDYKVKEYIESNHYGKFEIEPLERGFGTTLGNALRRVMLSSLPGDAITSVKIDGVAHEFQKIDGVIEDVTAIVLNLKSIVLKNHAKDGEKVIRLTVTEPGVVTAADIEKGKGRGFPRQLQNVHADTYTMEREQGYLYPHDYPNHWVPQQYLPDDLAGTQYYHYGPNKLEQAAKQYWDQIKKV